MAANLATDPRDVISRLADSLEHSVLQYIDNHYAQLQVRAAREMLLNLSARVEWKRADLVADENCLQLALDTLAAQGMHPSAAIEGDGPPAMRARLASVIDGAYHCDGDEASREASLAAIWRVVRSEFDAEADKIKTGMYA
jgi:hypothetical protein